MKITHRSAKNKGARFQKEVAARISELLSLPYGKDECIASRPMGSSSVDIILVGPARRLFPWSCECKAAEDFRLKSWIRQAASNVLPETNWLVLFKRNRFRPSVCMDFVIFSRLFAGAYNVSEIESANWSVDTYIRDSRAQSGNNWAIKLRFLHGYVVVMDMEAFFIGLDALDTPIKGVQTYEASLFDHADG